MARALDTQGDAFVVTVTRSVAEITDVVPPPSASARRFRNAGVVGSDVIAPGDTLEITVYENVKDEPLLGNTGQRVSALSTVQVDGRGLHLHPLCRAHQGRGPDARRPAPVHHPPAGGPDPRSADYRWCARPATGPACRSRARRRGDGVFPIEASTRTLATMLAKSGGVTIDPGHRHRPRHARQPDRHDLAEGPVRATPRLDIALRPGDKIVVEEDSRNFIALGATGGAKPGALRIRTAVGAGGDRQRRRPFDRHRRPDGRVRPARRRREGRQCRPWPQRSDRRSSAWSTCFDLTEPTSLFEARDFQIRDGDTLYVTEAPFVQWQKTLSAITGSTAAATNLANTSDLFSGN